MGSPYKSDLIDLSVILVHQTDDAILVDHGGEKPVWIPKAIVEMEHAPTAKSQRAYNITLPESWALKKGLI